MSTVESTSYLNQRYNTILHKEVVTLAKRSLSYTDWYKDLTFTMIKAATIAAFFMEASSISLYLALLVNKLLFIDSLFTLESIHSNKNNNACYCAI